MRIKKGDLIDFNVNVEGEPNPKIQWFINDTPLATADRTKIDNTTDNNTKLRIRDAERVDSGTYKIVATNEHGRDEAEVKVIVLGEQFCMGLWLSAAFLDVPGQPKGPLDVNDVTKDSAVLKWYAPDDDGGSPITHYVVEKQEDNGKWVPVSDFSAL